MCFSPEASFIAAGVIGLVGLATLSRVNDRREWLLAAAPLLFAAQQCVEGLLWLNLRVAPRGPVAMGLVLVFLLTAEVVWPVFAPLAVLFAEPDGRRRRPMTLLLCVGAGVAAFLLWRILTRTHFALIVDDHIVYVTEWRYSAVVEFGYLAATTLPLILSSRRTLMALGVLVLIGSVVAYSLYWQAFVSVWCFFAAAASGALLAHFVSARRPSVAVA